MIRTIFITIVVSMAFVIQGHSQPKQVTLKADPDPVVVEAGETVNVQIKAVDEDGNVLPEGMLIWQVMGSPSVMRDSGLVPSSGASVDSVGNITGKTPGEFRTIVMRPPANQNEGFAFRYLDIRVVNKPIAEIKVVNMPSKLYAGTIVPMDVRVLDELKLPVMNADLQVSSANTKIATVDNLNNVYVHKEGKVSIKLKAGEVENDLILEVAKNPVESIALTVNADQARTGDVLKFEANAIDKNGNPVDDIAISYSLRGMTSEAASGATAQVASDGRFVAEKEGIYTITASSGNRVAQRTVKIVPRGVERDIEVIGKGSITDQHTSDFWVWEGTDGRDYAVTGTWGSDGKAFFWDVTNPASIQLIDSVQVDARTVNDVKVSEDGKVCVISREGASNRKNGIVILDVTDPKDVKELSTYTEQLTGGVHNLYIYEDHVYALSNGQKYEIINIADPSNPTRVGKFEIGSPGRAIHDVWIENGIAYSSNWNDGVIMVDVGNGVAGGSPSNPVEIARARVEGDANHAAFPFKSQSTGKFFVIAGDEIFPDEAMTDLTGKGVFIPAGYLHFMDFSDPDNPVEVARYEVPGAGSHNFWVEGDLLYIGYYNGGVRVVDISGELMGDLYKQGRDVASFVPWDSEGYIPNNPMVWGAQPYKGHVFFSDFNTGLWAVKVKPVKPEETKLEAK